MPSFTFDWQCGERTRRETHTFDTPEQAIAEARLQARSMRQDAMAGEEDRSGWHLAVLDAQGSELQRVSVDQNAGPSAQGLPGAGPHAEPGLMNEDATPGAGTLAPVGESDDTNIQPTG